MAYDSGLDDEALQSLFTWIDSIPFSRKKKNITRDFSDGLLVAEIMHHYFPRYVEIHNYVSANSVNQKLNNWGTLNRKVLSKIGYPIPSDIMRKIAECSPGIIEVFLYGLLQKIESHLMKARKGQASFSDDHDALSSLSSYHEEVMETLRIGGIQNRGVDGVSHVLRFTSAYFYLLQSIKQLQKGATPESRPYYNARTSGGSQAMEGDSASAIETEYTIKNPLPISQLNLSALDSQTRLILEEKEQALLASQETVQILQVKIRRLEHLLHLKDLRLQDMQQKMLRYDSVSSAQFSQYNPSRTLR